MLAPITPTPTQPIRVVSGAIEAGAGSRSVTRTIHGKRRLTSRAGCRGPARTARGDRVSLGARAELGPVPGVVCPAPLSPGRCRVAPGDLSPGAPTDPDMQISRIRLVRSRIRYAIDGVD